MKRLRAPLIACVVLLLVCGMASSASASAFTLVLGQFNQDPSGSTYSGPYAQVTIADLTDSTTALVTFTALENGGFLYLLGDGSSAALNVDATSFSVSGITATFLSGFGTSSAYTVVNPLGTSQVDGWGQFNMVLDNFDGFTDAATSISFTLTNLTGLWATASDVLGPNADGYSAAAHIFACDVTGTLGCLPTTGAAITGYASGSGGGGGGGGGQTPAVPEPASLLLLGTGLAAIAARVRRERQR